MTAIVFSLGASGGSAELIQILSLIFKYKVASLLGVNKVTLNLEPVKEKLQRVDFPPRTALFR